MENVTMSEQEMMERDTIRSNKEVTQILETHGHQRTTHPAVFP